jgi:hypothetical protein
MKKMGLGTPCHECEDTQTAQPEHHQNLPDWDLLGDYFEKCVFNGKSSH